MAELSKIFKSSQELTDYLNGENIPSNVLGVVVEDETVKEIAFGTNDIEGEYKTYRITDEYPTPTGTINITENGENIDVKQYSTANVNVSYPVMMRRIQYDENNDIIPFDTTSPKEIMDYNVVDGKAQVFIIFYFLNTNKEGFSFDGYKNLLKYSNNGYSQDFVWYDEGGGLLSGMAYIDYANDPYLEVTFISDMIGNFFVNLN